MTSAKTMVLLTVLIGLSVQLCKSDDGTEEANQDKQHKSSEQQTQGDTNENFFENEHKLLEETARGRQLQNVVYGHLGKTARAGRLLESERRQRGAQRNALELERAEQMAKLADGVHQKEAQIRHIQAQIQTTLREAHQRLGQQLFAGAKSAFDWDAQKTIEKEQIEQLLRDLRKKQREIVAEKSAEKILIAQVREKRLHLLQKNLREKYLEQLRQVEATFVEAMARVEAENAEKYAPQMAATEQALKEQSDGKPLAAFESQMRKQLAQLEQAQKQRDQCEKEAKLYAQKTHQQIEKADVQLHLSKELLQKQTLVLAFVHQMHSLADCLNALQAKKVAPDATKVVSQYDEEECVGLHKKVQATADQLALPKSDDSVPLILGVMGKLSAGVREWFSPQVSEQGLAATLAGLEQFYGQVIAKNGGPKNDGSKIDGQMIIGYQNEEAENEVAENTAEIPPNSSPSTSSLGRRLLNSLWSGKREQ